MPERPTTHIKQLCKELGPQYSVDVIDGENVIYRDFGNGYDVEISGVDTSKLRKRATIYLWKDKVRVIKQIDNVPQGNIGDRVEELFYLIKSGAIQNEEER